MNSRFINDITKVVNGVSLIAKEFAKRSDIPNQGSADILQSLVKKTASVCGLTRGNVHQFRQTNPNSAIVVDAHAHVDPSNSKDSIVFFDANDPATATASPSVTVSAESLNSPDLRASESVGVVADDRVVEAKRVAESEAVVAAPPVKKRKPRERKVPSNRFSRAFGFASLGAGLAWGAAQESAKRLLFPSDSLGKQSTSSAFLSDKNAERLALALCRMRGAALKIGQMLSIQDESLVPAPLLAALEIVRQGADVMPRSQINKVLDAELGPDWSSKMRSFNYEPMAAASIGQVHQAVTRDGMKVAVKIQYPGVADSIESDIDNLKKLDDTLGLVPKGLYLDRVVETDPNWSNYLFDEPTKMINLIDFGAARDFPKTFVDDYLKMVVACANCDRDVVIEMSRRLGFITGLEPDVMLDAHVQAGFVVGLPFSKTGGYDFRSTNITQSLSNLGATMLKHRLTPPPAEAYSLHRKLSGAFLACIKLGAVVPCRELLFDIYERYNFAEENAPMSNDLV